MADPDKVPDSEMDGRATCGSAAGEVEEDSEPTQSSMLSESQDFRLVDEETQKAAEEGTQVTRSADKARDSDGKPSMEAEKKNVCEPEAEEAVKAVNQEIEVSVKTEEVTRVEEEEKDKEVVSDTDDDFVPSSQVELPSPLRTQVSGLTGAVSQKRKAETSDVPLAKFPRTCSQEDALSSARKKLDDEHDLFDEESTVETLEDDVISNVVIQETQESCANGEGVTESLQQVEKDLQEALSQHGVDDELAKMSDSERAQASSPANDEASPETRKSSTTEAPEENAKLSVEAKKSAAETTIDETKSPPAEALEEKTSPNGAAVDETISATTLATEEVKSWTADAEKEAKSVDNEDAAARESRSAPTDKSDATAAPHSSKEPEKIDPVPDTTAKDVDQVESTKDSPTVSTKDKEADTAPGDPPHATDHGAVASRAPELGGETQSEPTVPIRPASKSRMSIEVIYDKATAPPEKKRPRELVEIDEDGEKIVLDSSQEGCDKSVDRSQADGKTQASYKSCESKSGSTSYKTILESGKETSNELASGYSLTNGSAEDKRSDSDKTASFGSDFFVGDGREQKIEPVSPSKKARLGPEVLISISDSEGDSFAADERATKSQAESAIRESAATIRIVEKEVSVLVKLKCLVQIDEATKEHVEKFITAVHCESTAQDLSRRRNSDASACLADISGNAGGNRDASPGSVTSNAQLYPLNPRLSLASSSSASSAASMNARLAANALFQLPRGPAKHAKKATAEVGTPDGRPETGCEGFEAISREWKNVGLLLASFFSCVRDELVASELHNGSTERVENSLERICSSTPELEAKDGPSVAEVATPKIANKRSRSTKRSRSKTVSSSGSNGLAKSSPVVETRVEPVAAAPSSSRKRKSSHTLTPSRQSASSKESGHDASDELLGKEVFAKWSDNKYYPGTVIGKTKTKFKVNFYDGQHKLIIEDFIVPMPSTLQVGLSVYATSTDDDYGSCGIIIDAKKVKDNVIYTVQTDEQEELRVQIKNIFLTNDQVQVLREETKVELKTPPSTPKHLGKVTLDNVIDGKRRSKRITTPVVLTPKSKKARGSLADRGLDVSKPSASGLSSGAKVELSSDATSDSNYSPMEETDMLGVQPELVGTPNEQETKGPASRIKGKSRSRKKAEDSELVAKLGPIPPATSNLFNGMSFLLTCASLDVIDRFQTDTKDSSSDPGTENEEEWTRKPFVRDRLAAQINAGGGKLYENFELIPHAEYDNTKLITNVPNLTKKSLLCLSVGIKAYNHQWIIRCCQENKIVNPSEEELPAGWSLMKQSYVEMFQRRNKKPFQTLPVIVVIPLIPGEKEFVTFWTQICQNAGGAVLLPETPDDVFIEGTVVLTNKRCPSWVIEKANSWSIPLVSTTWVVQSLIEGNICTYDAHPSFEYNFTKRSPSHISNLKRLQ